VNVCVHSCVRTSVCMCACVGASRCACTHACAHYVHVMKWLYRLNDILSPEGRFGLYTPRELWAMHTIQVFKQARREM